MHRPGLAMGDVFTPFKGLLITLAWMGLILAAPSAQAQSGSPKPRPPLGAEARFSGEWERVGQTNQGQYLVLDQEGETASGFYRFPEGWAKVRGRVLNDRLRLDIVFDDPELLARWLPLQVAREVKGISSALDLVWSPDSKELKGPFSPFYVRFDPQTYAVSLTAQGGTKAAAEAKPPEHSVFRRVKSGSAGPRPAPPVPAGGGGLKVEAEEALDFGFLQPDESQVVPISKGAGGRAFRLARGGDWLLYTFLPPEGGTFHLWLRDFNDPAQPARGRTLEIFLNGAKVTSAPANDAPDRDGWGWHRVAEVRLTRAKQVLLIVKEATTPDPALLDAWGLTRDPGAPPGD